MATADKKKVAESVSKSVQPTETAGVVGESTDTKEFQTLFEIPMSGYAAQTAMPTQAQPKIAVRTEYPQEEIINAKYLSTHLAMADMLERIAFSVKHTVQCQLDSSLDVAAKQQIFYNKHTLESETAQYVPPYSTFSSQPHPVPFVYNQFVAIPPHIQTVLENTRRNDKVLVAPDGTLKRLMLDGNYATLFSDASWTVSMRDGTLMRVS